MNDEKVKEIKKALECCVDSIKYGCEGCPYHKSSSDCQELLIWDMQTYINELEEDKEKWQRKAVNYYQRAKYYGVECIIDNDIDETLKEYEK